MKICINPLCNREFSDDMAFCPYCGTKWIPQKRKCPNPECGFEDIPEGALYCPNCGLKFDDVKAEVLGITLFGVKIESTENEETHLSPVIQRLINNMVHVEGGTFTMGATPEQNLNLFDRLFFDEHPHQVTLSSFSIGRYEVTQEEWEAVMGSNPSRFKGMKLPVEQVSWNDCQDFIRKLNELTGKQFRLPTEAEWEYAARGGSKSRGYKYAGGSDIGSVAWYWDNSGGKTHEVGQKQANELGLHDMSGNVWEWCQNWKGSYGSSSQKNPQGPSSGSRRVNRDGSWNYYAGLCRVSNRGSNTPDDRISYLGFRLAQ